VLSVGKVRPTGKVVRAICVLNHPIPNTDNSPSCQIIIPQRQTGRQHDIYVGFMSAPHCVCSQGYFLAICSTQVETSTPEAELQPAYALLGEIMDSFVKVYDTYAPISDGRADKVFVSQSFDATSHFETAVDDMLSLYERIMGEPLNYEEQLKPFIAQDQPAEGS
jgi:Rab GDP dissociation inhibitor